MIKFIRNLSQETMDALRMHLENNIKSYLDVDVSSYAPGRKRLWLMHGWDLKDKVFHPGLNDKKLWAICKKIWPQAELGLVSNGSIGIGLHGDDSYADWIACGINLGKCRWIYERKYPDFRYVPESLQLNPPEISQFDLTGGEVFLFNCKNRHAARDCADDRWSINLWHIKKDFRKDFIKYMRSVSN